jgi:hypothetical protein
MKFPIEWHERCLANRINYNQQEKDRLHRLEEETKRADQEIREYADQIKLAKERGLKGFDSDRLGKNRR